MNREVSVVADCLQASEYRSKVHSTSVPGIEMMKAHLASAKGRQRFGAVRIETMVLGVNIHQEWPQPGQCVRRIGLSTQQEIGRLVNQTKVGAIDFCQHVQNRIDFFE